MPEHASLNRVSTRRLLTILIPLVILGAATMLAVPFAAVQVVANLYERSRAAEARERGAITDQVAQQLRARPDVLEAEAEYRDVWVWDEDDFAIAVVTTPDVDVMPIVQAAQCLAWMTPLPLRVIGVQVAVRGETGIPRSIFLHSSDPEWATLGKLCGPRPTPR